MRVRPLNMCSPPSRPPRAPHGVYVTGDTYAVLTNQSTGIAYVTACTYAFRPIRARYSNEGAPPQYVCAPLARPLRPPRPPLRPPKNPARSAFIILLVHLLSIAYACNSPFHLIYTPTPLLRGPSPSWMQF